MTMSPISSVTSALFLGLTAVMAVILVSGVARWVSRTAATAYATVIGVWLVYTGWLGISGVVTNPNLRPPGIMALGLPLVSLIAFFFFSGQSKKFQLAVPVEFQMGVQGYRVAVELLLHQLWIEGMIPRMLTFEGANFDILIGISAPAAAWIATRPDWGRKAALAWNAFGLCMLGNVVVRSVLTAQGGPGLLLTEVPNRLPGTFPFVYLAAFLAPLAFCLHVTSIQTLLRTSTPPRPPAGQPR